MSEPPSVDFVMDSVKKDNSVECPRTVVTKG